MASDLHRSASCDSAVLKQLECSWRARGQRPICRWASNRKGLSARKIFKQLAVGVNRSHTIDHDCHLASMIPAFVMDTWVWVRLYCPQKNTIITIITIMVTITIITIIVIIVIIDVVIIIIIIITIIITIMIIIVAAIIVSSSSFLKYPIQSFSPRKSQLRSIVYCPLQIN